MDKGSGSGIFPDPDPDPGDQKRPDPTGSGSGSATLAKTQPISTDFFIDISPIVNSQPSVLGFRLDPRGGPEGVKSFLVRGPFHQKYF